MYKQTGQKVVDNNLKTVSVHLGIGKSLVTKGKLGFAIQLGLGYERVYNANMLYYSHYSNIYARSDENSSNYNRGFFTSSVSLPLTLNTKGKTSFWISPNFKTSINSYLNSNFEKQHPYFYGVLAGIKYNL